MTYYCVDERENIHVVVVVVDVVPEASLRHPTPAAQPSSRLPSLWFALLLLSCLGQRHDVGQLIQPRPVIG